MVDGEPFYFTVAVAMVMSTSLVMSSKRYRCIACGVTEIPKDSISSDVTEVKIIW